MKKVLFTATVDSHILNFHVPYLQFFKEQGYEVHVASNGNNEIPFVDVKHNVRFERSPIKFQNLKVYKQLKTILDDNYYELIHCHTPMGSVLTRLAARETRKKGTLVFYTAHGLHFFSRAPLMNWLLFYPIEKWLARYTDCLITINQEDYVKVTSHKFQCGSAKLVNGVGVDLKKFHSRCTEKKNNIRKEYGYTEKHFILLYAAELSHRKHQDLLITMINIVKNNIPNIKLLLAGTGPLSNKYKKLVNTLGINENVEFLGYRKDVIDLLSLSDVAVSSSRQEGLPVNVMEAMAMGLPLIVTDCRGNRDLVSNNDNGYIVGINDAKNFAHAVETLYESELLRNEFGQKNLQLIKKNSLESVIEEMKHVYISASNQTMRT